MPVVQRVADVNTDALARSILKQLEGMTGQQASDVLLLALVLLIEDRVDPAFQAEAAAGVSVALTANFK